MYTWDKEWEILEEVEPDLMEVEVYAIWKASPLQGKDCKIRYQTLRSPTALGFTSISTNLLWPVEDFLVGLIILLRWL